MFQKSPIIPLKIKTKNYSNPSTPIASLNTVNALGFGHLFLDLLIQISFPYNSQLGAMKSQLNVTQKIHSTYTYSYRGENTTYLY